MPRRGAAFQSEAPATSQLAAGAVLAHRPSGELLLLHQAEEDRWCLPKGHVEPGESVATAARREVEEETGIRDVVLGAELAEVHYRFFDPALGQNVVKTTIYLEAETRERATHREAGFDGDRWVSGTEALTLLPFPEERAVLRRWIRRHPTPPRRPGPAPP